jgi:hypothetical protein
VDPGLLGAFAVALSGGAAAGGSILLVTALLASDRGRSAALAYVLGYLGAYVAIGLIVVAADVDPGAWTSGDDGWAGPAILVGFGLLLVGLGLRNALRPPSSADPGVGRPARALDRVTPPRSFGLGVAVAFVNVKNLALFLSAIAVLQASDLAAAGKLTAAPLVAATFSLAVFVPITIDALAPARSGRVLAALRRAIERHGRRLATWLPLAVGVAFVARGVRGLA